MLDPVFIAAKRCQWADVAKRAVVEVGKRSGSSGVLEKSRQSLLALQTLHSLSGICQVGAKTFLAFVDDSDHSSRGRVEKIVGDIARHSQTSEQHPCEQKRMGLERDGKF